MFSTIFEDFYITMLSRSGLAGKYEIALSRYSKKQAGIEVYDHLQFFPLTRNPATNHCAFALELNDDPKLGKVRFAFGVRKEWPCKMDRTMTSLFESAFGTKNKDWFLGRNNIPDKQMNCLHWVRWSFLGDISQYLDTYTSPQIAEFPDLVKNPSLHTTRDDFLDLLTKWLMAI